MIELLPKIPIYQTFRKYGLPKQLPINLTVSLTYNCNSRCKTCNIYKRKTCEFSYHEYDRVFQSIGKAPFWITLSGGEPFLRNDIVQICRSIYRNCKPKIINIPSNGILTHVIVDRVDQIVRNCPGSKIIINLSIDEIGERHCEIRNFKNNYQLVLETFQRLKRLRYANLVIGIHTVISKYNVNNFPHIFQELSKLEPDSYITEIAEERVELDTMGLEITPTLEQYTSAINCLQENIRKNNLYGISSVTQAFRLFYYDLVRRILQESRQVIPCYAAFASAQISPDGEVWDCCIQARSLGDLREHDYDFKKVWFSSQADTIRNDIKKGECFCPLANASYTNILLSYKSLGQVLKNLVWLKFAHR